MFEKQPHGSRRLLALFAATTLVPAASLAWLGWRMVGQDQLLQSQRLKERRDQAAELAAAALQRILAEAEEKLTTFSATPSATANLEDGEALVVFGDSGVLARAGTPLSFYPG